MHLIVLAVPGCPHASLLEDRVALLLRGRDGVSLSREVIFDEDEAIRWGMHGSPTLLIDGTDPFAQPGQPPSLSCRMYQAGDRKTAGAPSASQLQLAIERALAAETAR